MNKKYKVFGLLLSLAMLSGCNMFIPNNDPKDPNKNNEVETSVTSVYLNRSILSLSINTTYQLTANVLPSTALNKNVTWSSSDSSVASVDVNGLISTLKQGTTTITVTSEDGNHIATCNVTVNALSENDNQDVGNIEVKEDDINNDFSITCSDSSTISIADGVYTLSPVEEMVYTLSGKLTGQIVIDASVKVELDLNGVSIECSNNSPIYVINSDDVEIKSGKDTTNYIYDNRETYTEDVDTQGKGAIYSAGGDLKFTGKGTTQIVGNYYNGIHTKDDFSLKNSKLKITAVNHGIKANDGITIESGTLDIDCGGDGMHTENTGLSNKGKQKGNVDISGGSILINSVGDGIYGAYNVNISGECDIEIKTDRYSSYSGTTVTTNDVAWYLKVPSSLNSSSYRYSAYVNNTWVDFTYKTTQSGGRSTYYIYETERDTTASSFTLYRFSSNQENSLTSYNAKSDAKAFSSYYDTLTVSSITSGKINAGSWTTYSTTYYNYGPGGMGPGGMSEGNDDKSEHSAKGIKADNEIHINGGVIAITAYDDGIHTNCDDVQFDNELYPTGDLYITDGSITISASDDGIHSDTNLYISGGLIKINESYEGIEGNTINISGGDITVIASDDGLNACDGKVNPAINISGGRVDETVNPSGDTDGIDSNGTYTQTGGIVIARGPNSSMAAALDSDGAVKLTGGTLIIIGSIEKTPSTTNMTKTTNLSGYSKGDHTINIGEVSISYTNNYTYAKVIVYSELGTASIAK